MSSFGGSIQTFEQAVFSAWDAEFVTAFDFLVSSIFEPLQCRRLIIICEYKLKRKLKFTKYQQGLSISKFNFHGLQLSPIAEFTDFVLGGCKLHLRL